jgi:hypothetical protein
MPQFILKITLGNEAMCTANDIARSLRNVAYTLQDMGNCEPVQKTRKIMDVNGNTVGSWKVK